MIKITKTFGIILIILGVAGYLSIDRASLSGLIPALLGMALIMLSQTARNEAYFKKSMQAAVMLTALGFIGSGLRVIESLFVHKSVNLSILLIAQILVTLACAVFIGLAVKLHFEARSEKH